MLTDKQIEQLKKIKELFDDGILTEEEYQTKKDELLNTIESSNTGLVDVERNGESNPADVKPDLSMEKQETTVLDEIGDDVDNTSEGISQGSPFDVRGTTAPRFNQGDSGSERKQFESRQSAGAMFESASAGVRAKTKIPFYKRKWFIGIVAIVVFLFAIGVLFGGGDETSEEPVSTAEETAEAPDTTMDEAAETAEEQSDEAEEPEEKPQAKLVSIKASYSGDTSKGTVLNDDNDGIEVTAKYDDGTTETVYGWTIAKPTKLKSGKKAKVAITYEGKKCDLKVKCTTQSKKQYRKSCKDISYKKLARKPDKYTGKNIKIYGRVVQVMEDGNEVALRVATKDDGYGYYDDIVYVVYEYGKNDSKILEDDMVKVYGIYTGTITYESTMGGNITIPGMVAKQVKVQ